MTIFAYLCHERHQDTDIDQNCINPIINWWIIIVDKIKKIAYINKTNSNAGMF